MPCYTLFKVLDDSGWITDSHYIGRIVFGHYRSRASLLVVSERHPGADSRAPSYPDIIADGHRFCPFQEFVALHRVERVAGCVDADIGSDETVIAYPHFSLVKDCEVEVGEKALPYMYVLAVVASKRLIELKPVSYPPLTLPTNSLV